MEEITAIYLGEKRAFDNGDDSDRVIIGNARPVNGSAGSIPSGQSDITLKGPAAIDELTPRLTYRFYGHWSTYRNKRAQRTEKQFHFKTFVANQPHDQAGVCVYLGKAPWIGPDTASKLWKKFRSDAVRILREKPEVAAAAVDRLTVDHAKEASEFLEQQKDLEDCYIQLASLLDRRGFRKDLPKRLIKAFGNRAAELIERDPHTMLVHGFPGCSFDKCDKMYADLGRPIQRIKRQGLCAWNATRRQANGDTWLPVTVAERAIEASVGGTTPNIKKALRFTWRSKLLAVHVDDSLNTWIAEDHNADAEQYVAKHIAQSTREANHWPDIGKVEGITDHQRAGLAAATQASIGMFLGGPGTGKTWTISRLVEFLQDRFGAESIAVASPTNKAAGRARAVMAEHGINCRTSSIHSLLGLIPGMPPEYNASNPLPFKVIILDESPMIDCSLYASILAARARGTMLLNVGDTNQLPPINHGRPIYDFIKSGVVPFGMLTEPQRNAGAIVEACDQIRQGKRWRSCDRLDLDCLPPENLKLIESRTADQQIELMLKLVGIAGQRGFDRIWDCQVITATNATRRKCNDLLQRELNPQGKAIAGNPFREGDKVSCTENGEYRDAKSSRDSGKVHRVSKREIGRVVDVAEKTVVVKFDFPDRTVVFPKGKSGKPSNGDSGSVADSRNDSDSDDDSNNDASDDKTGCALRLAYAETCHTMQGSETPWAIPIIEGSRGAMKVCSREWVTTAFSRGKRACTPIGQRAVVDRMCRRVAIERRKTFLAELIQQEVRGL